VSASATKSIHGSDYHPHNPWYFFTTGSDLNYALRTSLAGIGALLAAMYLQFDVPRWAAWTVFVVSPPVRGSVLRKTTARVLGTLVACVVSVAGVGLFPQHALGFYTFFTAWYAVCAYWGSLTRGFVSYGAGLAAFTTAIVVAGAPSEPQGVFFVAINRGSATLLGVLFALLASEVSAHSDDINGDFAHRVCAVAGELIDWAVDFLKPSAAENGAERVQDAPVTRDILNLDELAKNAMASRPALRWVKRWIVGLPTALLCIQTGVLSIGRSSDDEMTGWVRQAMRDLGELIRSGAETSIAELQKRCSSLSRLAEHLEKQPRENAGRLALMEIVSGLRYFVACIESILMLKEPILPPTIGYPPPQFLPRRAVAMANALAAFLGIGCAYFIWDATAWNEGSAFVTYVAVAVVLFLALDDPVTASRVCVVATLFGAAVALLAKYFLLPWFNNPIWLSVLLFALVFPAVWLETKPRLAPFGILFVNAQMVLLAPTNPQHYNLEQDINGLVVFVTAFYFVSLVFLLVSPPRTGQARIDYLLHLMRRQLARLQNRPVLTADARLRWETQMYDAVQKVQMVSKAAESRTAAVGVLLAGHRAIDGVEP